MQEVRKVTRWVSFHKPKGKGRPDVVEAHGSCEGDGTDGNAAIRKEIVVQTMRRRTTQSADKSEERRSLSRSR